MLCIGAPPGLRELTLSANPRIGTKAWARFAIAVAHSSQLRVLNLDYNPLGKAIRVKHTASGSGSDGSGSVYRRSDCGYAGSCCGIKQNPGGPGPGRNRTDQPVSTGPTATVLRCASLHHQFEL